MQETDIREVAKFDYEKRETRNLKDFYIAHKGDFSNARCKTSMFPCVGEEFYGKREVLGKYLLET